MASPRSKNGFDFRFPTRGGGLLSNKDEFDLRLLARIGELLSTFINCPFCVKVGPRI